MADAPHLLARGPWPLEAVDVAWRDELFDPPADRTAAADDAIDALRDRGSPSHDGVAARLIAWSEEDGRLRLVLQPMRWALRLVPGQASDSLSAHCVIRDARGRWLAGRRAAWLAVWAGRWSLGAAGAVDLGENPARTLLRELDEEWAVTPERCVAEALIRLPQDMIMFLGQAWLPEGAEVTPDDEHDAYAWWPADPGDWPEEADEPLRRVARLLA